VTEWPPPQAGRSGKIDREGAVWTSKELYMESADTHRYHRLFGEKKPRIAYRAKDFIDYALMCLISIAIAWLVYGSGTPMAWASVALGVSLIATFALRHGATLSIPILLRRPQDALSMLYYKFENLKLMYVVALGVLLFENLLIRLTPQLPHHVDTMRSIALWLFWIHFGSMTLVRTAIFIAHLKDRALALEILQQTSWKQLMPSRPNIVLEIFHAYFTGLLTHILLIAPWYFVIQNFDFSLLLLPVVLIVNVYTQMQYMKVINDWFYRDHWLGHNSELEFVYLHGTHHDAIPSGMIGVAGNGIIEGFLRHSIAAPSPFYNPIVAFLFYTFEVKTDMQEHQYIPGIYPRKDRGRILASQHSTHHFGRIEPYGFGVNIDQPDLPESARKRLAKFPPIFQNAIKVDMRLNGFKWDNPTYRRYIQLFDKYQPADKAAPSRAETLSEPSPD
jgi:hypothetical protein